MKKRWIIMAIVFIALLIVATIFITPLIRDKNKNSDTPVVEETTENTEADKTTDKTTEESSNLPLVTPSAPVEVPEQVQEVIKNNEGELYKDNANLLAAGYPSQLIPLYGATTVSESQLITSADGQPGWLTSFASEKPVVELVDFYRSLLNGLPGYSEEVISESTNFKATSGSYSVDLTVSPNIQEKTGLPGQSAASIYIEQVQ